MGNPGATLDTLVSVHPSVEDCRAEILAAYELIVGAFRNGHKLLLCGNGGSAADCDHIAAELMKGYLLERRIPDQMWMGMTIDIASRLQGALPTISLASNPVLMTAIANDIGAKMIFAQQVYGLGGQGDVLLAISTSGLSANVVRACAVARAIGMRIVGLTGATDATPFLTSRHTVVSLSDVAIRAPGESTAEVQEFHRVIYHALCEMLEAEFFG